MARDPLHPVDLERLTSFGTTGGPTVEETLEVFARLRRTPHERRAADWLATRNLRFPLPDPLLVVLASALLDRGDAPGARTILDRATSSTALLLRADLLADAGDLATALILVERVLFRDLDWPGARERHARWTAAVDGPAAGPARRPRELVPILPPNARFDLVREVGRGGAGVVFEARDRALGRVVALKVYHRPDRDAAQLLHEARVASAVAGPGVVRVFDVHPREGWLAMEWAPLGALGSLLWSGHVAAIQPIGRWAEPLARALARIHAAGWVHHDIKPANVLLSSPASPWIVDFGAARRVGEPASAGSAGYVSPERQEGRPSDPRDDVFGFGRVLEDALDVLGDGAAEARGLAVWRALAAACTGPDAARPVGPALLARANVRD